MLLKKNSVKEYTDNNELKEFCEQTWGDYIRELDESIITNLLSIQSHGLKKGSWFDDRIIKVYKAEIQKFPPIPFDIIVYRGGDMNTRGRLFLSASFYKKTAERFAQKKSKLHTIVLRKGSCIVPSLYIWYPLSFSEQEVVIDVSCLHKRIGIYEYNSFGKINCNNYNNRIINLDIANMWQQ